MRKQNITKGIEDIVHAVLEHELTADEAAYALAQVAQDVYGSSTDGRVNGVALVVFSADGEVARAWPMNDVAQRWARNTLGLRRPGEQ